MRLSVIQYCEDKNTNLIGIRTWAKIFATTKSKDRFVNNDPIREVALNSYGNVTEAYKCRNWTLNLNIAEHVTNFSVWYTDKIVQRIRVEFNTGAGGGTVGYDNSNIKMVRQDFVFNETN